MPNVNQLSITISEPVEQIDGDPLAANDLTIVGVNVADYASRVSGFVYNEATHTATISFDQPFGPDKLLVSLDKESIVDGGRNLLVADLSFRLDTLPGDADRSGAVLSNDVGQLRLKQLSVITGAVPSSSMRHPFHPPALIRPNPLSSR